jgi:hypothetical protein
LTAAAGTVKKDQKNAFLPFFENGAWRSCSYTWEAEIRGESAYSGPEGGGVIVNENR